MRKILIISLLLFSLVSVPFSYAQTDDERIAQLRQQIEQLQQQADQYKQGINQSQEQANTLNAEIQDLKNQISALQIEINITNKNIDKTNLEIDGVQNSISDTQQQITTQKATVGQLLQFLHRQDNESLLEAMLKNSDLSDYFRQEEYALKINANLLDTMDQLKQNENTLTQQKSELDSKKNNLIQYQQQKTAQKSSLDSANSTKNNLLKATKGQEAEYQKLLQDTERKEAEFFTQLQVLEGQVVANGLYIVHIVADKVPAKGKIFQWPSESTRITQGYGYTSYARSGAYGGAIHNGIDIGAGYGSDIKAIGDGEVVAEGTNDGWGNWIAIRHPNQYNLVSVYAHMEVPSFLSVGAQVAVGQVIGYEGATGNVTGPHVHLSIYKDFFTFVSDVKKGQLYFNYNGTLNPLDYVK